LLTARVVGVAFEELTQGLTGVALNAIELHLPVPVGLVRLSRRGFGKRKASL